MTMKTSGILRTCTQALFMLVSATFSRNVDNVKYKVHLPRYRFYTTETYQHAHTRISRLEDLPVTVK